MVKHPARPNWTGNCNHCGAVFERYVFPSKRPPQFCSNECRMSTVFTRPKTAEYRAKLGLKGERHPNWVGDAVSVTGGRARALRLFPSKPCSQCGAARSDRHHVDGNTANNSPENIRFLCRLCHMQEDGRLKNLIETRRKIANGA